MAEINEENLARYGDLKLSMESEGDGYFFYGYGLPSEYQDDEEIVKAFKEAEQGINNFQSLVEKRIIDNGGRPEDFTY